MRLLLATILLALPLTAATKPLPGHVTLVRPALPEKRPVLRSLQIPAPRPTPVATASAACSHIRIVPAEPAIDANIVRPQTHSTHQMPTYAGRPACR